MQKFALTTEISTKVAGGGLLFCVQPVHTDMTPLHPVHGWLVMPSCSFCRCMHGGGVMVMAMLILGVLGYGVGFALVCVYTCLCPKQYKL